MDAAGLPGALSVAGLDIADEESVVQFCAAADAQLGGANVLINNAGILRDGLLVSGEGSGASRLPATPGARSSTST